MVSVDFWYYGVCLSGFIGSLVRVMDVLGGCRFAKGIYLST